MLGDWVGSGMIDKIIFMRVDDGGGKERNSELELGRRHSLL